MPSQRGESSSKIKAILAKALTGIWSPDPLSFRRLDLHDSLPALDCISLKDLSSVPAANPFADALRQASFTFNPPVLDPWGQGA